MLSPRLGRLRSPSIITEIASWAFACTVLILTESQCISIHFPILFFRMVVGFFLFLSFLLHHLFSRKFSIEKCLGCEAFLLLFFTAFLIDVTGRVESPLWVLYYFPVMISIMVFEMSFVFCVLSFTSILSFMEIGMSFLQGRLDHLPIIILNIFSWVSMAVLGYLLSRQVSKEKLLNDKILRDLDQALKDRDQHVGVIDEKTKQVEDYGDRMAEINRELMQHQTHLLNLTQDLEKANQELKAINRMKSEFVSIVSHELRTPLTAIKESVSLLLEDADKILNLEQRKFLDITKSNVERLTYLIQDILDFSKLESGKMNVRKEKVDLGANLQLLEEFYIDLCQKKNIHLSFDSLKREPFYVYADPDRLRQIWDNLLNNAIKFTSSGQKIKIYIDKMNRERVLELMKEWKADEELLTLAQMEQITVWKNFIVVSIQDTGVGITPQDRYRIFEKFFQIDVLDTRPKGTGLGLAIVKQVVLLHRGGLWVESKMGTGSNFRICLPAYEEACRVTEELEQLTHRIRESHLNGMLILLSFSNPSKKIDWNQKVFEMECLHKYLKTLSRMDVHSVYHMGGGQILMVSLGSDHAHPLKILERIRDGIRQSAWKGWATGLRFGLQSFSSSGTTVETLLHQIEEMKTEIDREK